jgi:hypothetical protein
VVGIAVVGVVVGASVVVAADPADGVLAIRVVESGSDDGWESWTEPVADPQAPASSAPTMSTGIRRRIGRSYSRVVTTGDRNAIRFPGDGEVSFEQPRGRCDYGDRG